MRNKNRAVFFGLADFLYNAQVEQVTGVCRFPQAGVPRQGFALLARTLSGPLPESKIKAPHACGAYLEQVTGVGPAEISLGS